MAAAAERPDAVVIGAGPAGLMAAEALADAGVSVLVAEAKPSAGRKLLMAGKSGLNLTKDEPAEPFLAAFGDAARWLTPILADFGPVEAQAWARSLGRELFTGSTGRVFPKEMKASPLLRAWLARLGAKGVGLETRLRWEGWEGDALRFAAPEGPRRLRPAATILALGGGSWPRLGSDGAWAPLLGARGVALAPFRPANMGFRLRWSAKMAPFLGAPVKSVALLAGDERARGEFVLTAKGIEGGGVYAVSRALREGAPLALALLPDVAEAEAAARLDAAKGASAPERLRKALRLPPEKRALLFEFARPLPADPAALARLAKRLPVPHEGPLPLEEAISTAGGIAQEALDGGLMLRALPGVFAAGEMLDWEAPTGGYLLTACLATGLRAGRAAAAFLGRG